MTAAVIPFPLIARRVMIIKQARYAAELSPEGAERHIQQQLRCQADVMRRKNIDPDLIARELKCMETAVRELVARAVSGGAQ